MKTFKMVELLNMFGATNTIGVYSTDEMPKIGEDILIYKVYWVVKRVVHVALPNKETIIYVKLK